MKSVYRYLLVTLFFTFYSSPLLAEKNDFDIVCQYFEKLDQEPNQKTMTYLERNDYILQLIQSHLSEVSNARGAWEAISNAEPSSRYYLFKSAAESVINKPWSCSAMEKLAPNTGEFE